jgi:hypothetical protein
MRRILTARLVIGGLTATPATADVILEVSVAGPGGSEAAFGEFASQAWGRAATGTVFDPNASVHEGLPPDGCCVTQLGGQAHAYARVDGTKGLAGARASASGYPDQDVTSRAEASGSLTDVLVFSDPTVTIDIDLIGSLFSNITGDAEGSAGLGMLVWLRAPRPGDPDVPFDTIYFGQISQSRDDEGTTQWSLLSSVSGPSQGTGTVPSLHLSETFLLLDSYLGVPIDLLMSVSAYANCREGTGNCSTVANSFDTGYLGITGSYTSTHSYPGLQQAQVPEPGTLGLVGLGLAALAGRIRPRRWSGRR